MREAPGSAFDFIADDAVVIAAHTRVGLIGRAFRQNVRVGCRNVGVRADNAGDAAVEDMADAHFLGSRLCVEVDENRLNFATKVVLIEELFHRRKTDHQETDP